jgi:hypothetical protein
VTPAALSVDVAIVGAGAAGLATAIGVGRLMPDRRVVVLDGARQIGAKILVSGGGRCNVTNVDVGESDFNGGSRPFVRRVLRRWSTETTIAFFRDLQVPLHEEPNGKLFPDSNRARDVLNALVDETTRVGATIRAGARVTDIAPGLNGFRLETSAGVIDAGAVVLATGGLSLPKTGSDGWGIAAARQLGHTIVPTTPALAPLMLASGAGAIHASLSGVSLPVRFDVRVDNGSATRIPGSLLWTHFGISGPAALDLSRHWLRAELERQPAQVTASLTPDVTFETLEGEWTEATRLRPRTSVTARLSERLPASIAAAIADALGFPSDRTLATVTREDRRRVLHALTAWPFEITGSRGYNYAEVTAGGVALGEVDAGTMESKVTPGVFFVGEILDVDGRLGGFNFQWAWASAHVASEALVRRARLAHHE